MSTRSMFLGGNTGRGFHSFFEQLVAGDAQRTFILKGGPGTGKSFFMNRILEAAAAWGEAAIKFHCSSDSDSLDAIHFPRIGVNLVDGTAPHGLEPKYPGVIDTVINLADYWDERALTNKRSQVQKAMRRRSFLFSRAYSLLRLARLLNDETEAYIRESGALHTQALNGVAIELIDACLGSRLEGEAEGWERHYFASAFAPLGLVNHLPSVIAPISRRIALVGPAGSGKSTIMGKLLEAARSRSIPVEVYHCPLDPQRIDHLLLPSLDISICNGSEPHVFPGLAAAKTIETWQYVETDLLAPYEKEVERLRTVYGQLLEGAIVFLRQAKENHALLESIYQPYMDFERVDKRIEEVLQEIIYLAS